MLAAALAFVLAAVSVAADGACLDSGTLTMTLETTLAVASGDRLSALDVQVIAAPSTAGLTAVSLTASTADGIVLARQFSLAQSDCTQGGDLLEAVLARFLDGFPRERWTNPALGPAEPPRKKPRKKWGITPRGGADLGLLPSQADPLIADTSGDFEIAIAPERSGASIEALLRQGTWSNVGEGRYQPVTFLAGAGWAWTREERSSHVGVRSGVLAIRGDRNSEKISEKLLPWVEVYADIAWKAGPVRIGPQVALSLIRVSAETASGADRRVVPTNRIGLRVEIPL